MKKLAQIPNIDIILLCVSLSGIILRNTLPDMEQLLEMLNLGGYVLLLLVCFFRANTLPFKILPVVYLVSSLLIVFMPHELQIRSLDAFWKTVIGPLVFFVFLFLAFLKQKKGLFISILASTPVLLMILLAVLPPLIDYKSLGLYLNVAFLVNLGAIMYYDSESEELQPYGSLLVLMFYVPIVHVLSLIGFH